MKPGDAFGAGGPSPPAPLRWVLKALLPAALREVVDGDLIEGFVQRVEARGVWSARLWYVRQVVTMPYRAMRREASRLEASRPLTTVGREGTMGTRMEWMFGEIRVALRSLMRRPAFSATVVGTLAASLGAATIIFSVLEGVLLRPLPYPDASELVTVHGTNEAWRTHENWMFRNSWDRNRLSLDQVDAFRSSGTLASVGASARDLMIIREGGPAEEISVERVGRGVFETLGVEPLLGRLPSRDELDRGAAVLVLSEELWTGRFGRDPSVTGRSVTLQGEPFDIVGVLPAEFDFPDEVVKAWTTLPAEDLLEHRGRANYAVVGRLRPGGDLSAATTILAETMTTMATEDSAWDGIGVRLVPRAEEVLRQVRSGLLLLFGAVIVVETLVHDLSTYAAVSFVLGLAALVAALVPAFRTTSLEPARVLGRE